MKSSRGIIDEIKLNNEYIIDFKSNGLLVKAEMQSKVFRAWG